MPWRRPSAFPRNGLLAARVGCAAPDAPWAPAFHRAILRANFAEDRDIADPALVRGVLDGLGLDGAALVARAGAPEVKQALRDRGEEARRLGLFGAPSLVVDGELFFGQDRLEDALAWAAGAPPGRQGP
ncbi:MAG: DsbA family protein [Anaeromyxobacteraceae bacterium]